MVLPASRSRLRNRFSSRNSLLRISSFNCASQVSCMLWISSASRSFCSGVSFSIQACLSNFCVAVGVPSEEKVLTVLIVDGGCCGSLLELGGGDDLGGSSLESDWVERGDELGGLGAVKNDVRLACALGFLDVEVAMSAALRFNWLAMSAHLQIAQEELAQRRDADEELRILYLDKMRSSGASLPRVT